MILTVEETKRYLRVDTDEEDTLIEDFIETAEQLVKDVARIDDNAMQDNLNYTKVAVMYAVAYLYEHREDADHHGLVLMLRAMLFGLREAKF